VAEDNQLEVLLVIAAAPGGEHLEDVPERQ
jgi:hypothetical protein